MDKPAFDRDPGERVRYTGELRPGGAITVTDSRVLVASNEETVSVPYTNVQEINNESFDWFLAVLSGALALFGVYSLTENPLLAVVFILGGLWSIRRTYRHRDRVRIHTHTQPKPIEVFPHDVEALYAELDPAIERVRARTADHLEQAG